MTSQSEAAHEQHLEDCRRLPIQSKMAELPTSDLDILSVLPGVEGIYSFQRVPIAGLEAFVGRIQMDLLFRWINTLVSFILNQSREHKG